MLDTTAKGSCGFRGSSRIVGIKLDSGDSGASGPSKSGRFFGAEAAACSYGAPVFKGGASGFWKSEGRAIGAYSGPSSHVAMQSS